MQRSNHYNYKNTTDGFYQIFKKSRKTGLISELYRGAGMFSFSFGMYTVFEFMFYETFLAGITNFSKYRSFSQHGGNSEQMRENHSKERNLWHVLVSSFMAGGLSAII